MTANIVVDQTREALIFHLLDWLDTRVRTYEEMQQAWQASSLQDEIWQEASARGLVREETLEGSVVIRLTSTGAAMLRNHRFLEIMRHYLKVVS